MKKWYGLARILPKCYLKLLHPFVCYSLSKDRCSAWKLPICCFDSIRAFDYRNCSHIPIYPSYINSLARRMCWVPFPGIFLGHRGGSQIFSLTAWRHTGSSCLSYAFSLCPILLFVLLTVQTSPLSLIYSRFLVECYRTSLSYLPFVH